MQLANTATVIFLFQDSLNYLVDAVTVTSNEAILLILKISIVIEEVLQLLEHLVDGDAQMIDFALLVWFAQLSLGQLQTLSENHWFPDDLSFDV